MRSGTDERVVGIDIGGSHITAAMIQLATGEIVDNLVVRHHIDRHAPAEVILRDWCNAIRQVWTALGIAESSIGFAMPGPFDYQQGISLIKGFDKYEALYQMNIRAELAQRLKIAEEAILFRNDAEAFLEGEVYYGAAKGFDHAIGITLGTGLGSASSHNGKTVDAELSVLSYKGERIEDYVSTRGIIRNYAQLTGQQLANARLVAERYETDARAAEAFRLFGHDLAWFLRYFIQQEQPQVLVVGGNIANSWPLFEAELMQQLSDAVPQLPVISMSVLGEHAALIGGASCFRS